MPDQLEDDGEHIQPDFDEHAPLSHIKWLEPDHANLTIIMKLVMKYSRWLVDQQCQRLNRKNATLTYNLMGVIKGYSSNEEATQNARPSENAKRKGKTIEIEEPIQKRQRIEPSHSATSRNEKYILNIDESLVEIEIPSLVHRENRELIHKNMNNHHHLLARKS